MKVIGITGQVGSGKSTIAGQMEKRLGAYLINTDEIARNLMKKGNFSYYLITDYFGTDILNEDGEIDKQRLSQIVFHEEAKLELLNSFTHPYVMESVRNKIKKIKEEEKASVILIETALLLEAGYVPLCDEIWYVAISEDNRRKRLKESRNYSDEKINSILKNQKSTEEYRKYCTKVIDNNADLEEIISRIQVMLVN